MITVAIMINNKPIITRSAFRFKKGHYKTDCGKTIEHKHEDGAVVLAKKMLDCVVDWKGKPNVKST